jgi:hypothetical protein
MSHDQSLINGNENIDEIHAEWLANRNKYLDAITKDRVNGGCVPLWNCYASHCKPGYINDGSIIGLHGNCEEIAGTGMKTGCSVKCKMDEESINSNMDLWEEQNPEPSSTKHTIWLADRNKYLDDVTKERVKGSCEFPYRCDASKCPFGHINDGSITGLHNNCEVNMAGAKVKAGCNVNCKLNNRAIYAKMRLWEKQNPEPVIGGDTVNPNGGDIKLTGENIRPDGEVIKPDGEQETEPIKNNNWIYMTVLVIIIIIMILVILFSVFSNK